MKKGILMLHNFSNIHHVQSYVSKLNSKWLKKGIK
uniref:Uncharacterized protein n=1 Tax=Anguilla anguilla TaxID=7936 RepID=A0A0E9XN67_ANGAN